MKKYYKIEYIQLEETYSNHVVQLSDQFRAENFKSCY